MNGPELRDIHLPEAVSWWPPAPGWWLLALAAALLAAFAWYRFYRGTRKPLRALSLDELERIRAAHATGADAHAALNELAGLLRRILISYRGRDGFAGSTGAAFAAQIRALSAAGFSDADLDLLGRARYRRDVEADVAALLEAGERWLRNLPREAPRAAA